MPKVSGIGAAKTQAASSKEAEISRLDVYDCQSIFDIVDMIRQYRLIAPPEHAGSAPNFDYRACFGVIDEGRKKHGFESSQNSLALATIDPESEGQSRFITAISRLGILVEPIDFRDASVTLPLAEDGERADRRYLRTLAPNITYVVGLLAARQSPEVVIVTRAFELFRPLRDFVEKRGGKAAIAFFRRFIDPRFGIAGLFEPDSSVKFIDLEPYAEQLVGCDVRQIGTAARAKAKGISGL